MGVNKVQYGSQVLLDISDATVTPDTLLTGESAYNAAGERIVGTLDMNLYVPPGMVVPYAGSTAPDGWLLCDGRTVSRTTYAALFAVIGTAYGAGDGSATFNLPDFRGRTAVGADSDNARGAKEGSKTHAMTEAQNGKHAHKALVSIPKSLAESNIVNGNYTRLAGLKSNAWSDDSVPSYSGMTTGIDYSGSSEPFSIMQPSLYVNYIIKY